MKVAIDIPEVTEIDVILATRLPEEKKDKPAPKNTIEVLLLALEAAIDEIMVNDIKMALLYNDLALRRIGHYRYINIRIIQPEQMEMPGNPMDFDNKPIKEMISMGYETAKRQLG